VKSTSIKTMLLCGVIAAALAAAGCNHIKPDPNPDPDKPSLTKEQVIESINANNRKINSIIYFMKATITSPRYPNGQNADLTIIYEKPNKLMLSLSILNGPDLLKIKTDGEYIDILDTFDINKPMGRIAKIERLKNMPGEIATFQPGFITKAVGADILDPSVTTMTIVEGAYILTMPETDNRIRRITVDSKTMRVVRQEIYKKLSGATTMALGAQEIDVKYLAHAEAWTDNNSLSAILPTHIVVTVYSGLNKSILDMKIPSVKKDNMRLNSERRVNLGTGGSWRIKDWGKAPIEELDENGQWVKPESTSETPEPSNN